MAYEPKGIDKKTSAPRPLKKERHLIISEPAAARPWYRQKKHIIFLSILCSLALFMFIYRQGVGEQPKTPRGREGIGKAAVSQPKEEAAPAMPVPEIVSIKLSPPSPVKGSIIKAEALTRGSGNIFVEYQWAKNGEPLDAVGDSFSSDFKKGDTISLTAVPSDGKQKGPPVTVVTHIFNSAPVITSTVKDSKFSGNVFTYQVKAEDRDNDTLTYTLLGWPEGMLIDPAAGLIQWPVPSGFKGEAKAMVLVSDGAGGEARQIFSIQINQGQEGKP